MEIDILNPLSTPSDNKKLNRKHETLSKLMAELRGKELSDQTIQMINQEVGLVNSVAGTEKEISRQISKSQSRILSGIAKAHGLVTKNHYRTLWMSMGIAVFGIPLGIAFGASMGNMGLLAIGMPIGLAIGIGVGIDKDNKAKKAGKQLDIVIER